MLVRRAMFEHITFKAQDLYSTLDFIFTTILMVIILALVFVVAILILL